MTSTTGRKTAYHHADLRNALQAVALTLTEERNGPHFSLRELATRIGISHAAVYRHFADKAALLEALTITGFGELGAYQEAAKDRADKDPLSQLHALNDAYIDFATEKPGFFSLMFGRRLRPEGDPAETEREQINAAALNALTQAIERCQDAGILIAGDPRRIAGYLVMAPHGYACYSTQDRAMVCPPEDLLAPREIAEIALIPLLAEPPGPRDVARRYFGAGKKDGTGGAGRD